MEPFKLHAVLKYRRQLEDRARLDFLAARKEEALALEKVSACKDELDTLYSTLHNDRLKGTTVTRLILLENRISLVKENLESAEKDLVKMQQLLETKRKALVKAGKDRRIMEKMEEQQNAAYKQYLDKKERVMLDELAVIYRKK